VRDQYSESYKTTDIFTILYMLLCIFLDRNLEDGRFWTELYQEFLELKLFLMSLPMQF